MWGVKFNSNVAKTMGGIMNFIDWLLSAIAIIAFFEIALRLILGKDVWAVVSEFNVLRNFEYHYKINNLYPSEQKIVKYKRNKFGLRDNCKDPSDIDILTIGDSVTDQRFVRDESTYQSVLEQLLSNHFGKKIYVSNAGIDGHSSYGYIRSFESWFPLIPNLKPKYVLLYFGIHDASFDRIYRATDTDVKNQKLKEKIVRASYLFKNIRSLIYYIRAKIAPKTREVGFRKIVFTAKDYTQEALADNTIEQSKINAVAFQTRLELIIKYIKEMGATPIFVTLPQPYTKSFNGKKRGLENIFDNISWSPNNGGLNYDYSAQQLNAIMHEVCGNDNVFDMSSVEFKDEHFYDGLHTTDIGSEFFGKKIFEMMKQKGLNL